jgi:peptidoglycan-N-acetylglucosamine deacetylase
MKLYWHKTAWLIQKLFPKLLWKRSIHDKIIYLTFDDGPIPDVTEFVLAELEKYNAQATFFCVGDNIRKHPQVFRKLIENGHRIGNHTFNHYDAWRTETQKYLKNVAQCQEIIENHLPETLVLNEKKLFRPPYGKINYRLFRNLSSDYNVVMWDVLSGDFDTVLSAEKCLEKTLKNTVNGSVVVFHDSIKAQKNLRYVLPRYLAYFSEKGYRFECL